MPKAVTVTPEEREAIQRLEVMGFDRAIVLQVLFACNKNEELAANYLLDHIHEFEDWGLIELTGTAPLVDPVALLLGHKKKKKKKRRKNKGHQHLLTSRHE